MTLLRVIVTFRIMPQFFYMCFYLWNSVSIPLLSARSRVQV